MKESCFVLGRVYCLAAIFCGALLSAPRQEPKVRPIDQQLLDAADSGNVASAQKALTEGANPNAANWDSNTFTALILAARNGNAEIVKMLLDKGAQVNRTAVVLLDALGHSRGGITALMEAAQSEDIPTIELLLNHKANVNARDSDGSPVLMYSPNAKIMRVFLNAHADPNVLDKQGYTILMRAAEMGDRDAVKLLLAHGAKPSLTGAPGKTALSLAEAKGEGYVVAQLKAAPVGR